MRPDAAARPPDRRAERPVHPAWPAGLTASGPWARRTPKAASSPRAEAPSPGPGQVRPGPCSSLLDPEVDGPEGIRARQAGIAADKAAVHVVGDDQGQFGTRT